MAVAVVTAKGNMIAIVTWFLVSLILVVIICHIAARWGLCDKMTKYCKKKNKDEKKPQVDQTELAKAEEAQ